MAWTVTVKTQALVLPLASVAVLVTVVVPTGKAKPLRGMLTRLIKEQLSDAETENTTLLVDPPGAAFAVTFSGHEICGGCASSTVTVKVHVLEFAPLSVATLVTVVVPKGKAKPLGGMLAKLAMPQLSEAFTVNCTLLEQTPGAAFTVRFAGQVMIGGSGSLTVTVKVQLLELPLASVAMLVTVVVPIGKAKLLLGVLTKPLRAQLSVAATVKVTLLAHWPAARFTAMFPGQLITGG